MRTWRPKWDLHMGLVGSTSEDYGILQGLHQEGSDLPRIRADLEVFRTTFYFGGMWCSLSLIVGALVCMLAWKTSG